MFLKPNKCLEYNSLARKSSFPPVKNLFFPRVCSWSASRPADGWTCLKHRPRKATDRLPPQPAALNVEDQQLYSDSPRWRPPLRWKIYFNHLFSHSFHHYPQFLTTLVSLWDPWRSICDGSVCSGTEWLRPPLSWSTSQRILQAGVPNHRAPDRYRSADHSVPGRKEWITAFKIYM